MINIVDDEVFMAEDEFIVSKTDLHGHITYTNRIFMEISLYHEPQLLNMNHNIIRHPDMPKGVFKLLWQTIKRGNEFFGFIKNLREDGRYYWVFANVTPEYDENNKLIGYLSVRRKPPVSAIKLITPIYQQMLAIEKVASSDKVAEEKSIAFLQQQIAKLDKNYQQFVINLFTSNN